MKYIIAEPVGSLFFILALGMLMGRLRVRGVGVGVAGVLAVALVMGHLGVSLPPVILSLGTVFFVSAVGLSAGERASSVLGRAGVSFVLLALATVGTGLAAAVLLSRALGLGPALGVGMMAGALTSTPGLTAALEATGGDPLVGIGYSVAYPLGVLGVVAGTNLAGLLHRRAREPSSRPVPTEEPPDPVAPAPVSDLLLLLSAVAVAGVLVGQIPIPVPGVGFITLGLAGGPLLVAILLGHLGGIGPLRASFHGPLLGFQRDLGATFILAQVGTAAGATFVELVSRYGTSLLLGGLVVTLVAVSVSLVLAGAAFKMSRSDLAGSISGAMTSTPGLTVAVDMIGDDGPAFAYAMVYPVAIVLNSIAARVAIALIP